MHPTLLKENELLAEVDGVMNAVMIKGDQAGPTAYYGAGAGGGATASAVVADCIDVARRMACAPESRLPGLGYSDPHPLPVLAQKDFFGAWYLRLVVEDRAGVLAKITGLLAEFNISIEAIHQDEPETDGDPVTLVLLTNEIIEAEMDEAQRQIEEQSFVLEPIRRLRVEHLES